MFKWSRINRRIRMGAVGENRFLYYVRVPHKCLYALLFTLVLVIVVLLLPSSLDGRRPAVLTGRDSVWSPVYGRPVRYNSTYPLTTPASK